MDYNEFDKADEERRQKEEIENRNKKRRSNIFLLCASAFSVFETVAILFVLFFLEAVVLFRVLKLPEDSYQQLYSIIMIVLFIVGIVLGHLLYLKLVRWVINKWQLKDKLTKDLINHYKTKKELLAEKNSGIVQ